jgi:hemerythrin-like domain-containing protein
MLPIGPLMAEHRIIEKMIALMEKEIKNMRKHNKVNPLFIDTAVDFIRMYADRTHHGKEEDILFRELETKNLSPNHSKIMEELVQEHIWAREKVKNLIEAKKSYIEGNINAVHEIIRLMEDLTSFYPNHIKKEDKNFFIPILKYFTDEEQEKMLQEFWDFDRTLIHEKYKKIVEDLSE